MEEAEEQARRSAKESLYFREIEKSLHNSDQGLAYVDEHATIINFNSRFESLFRLVTGRTPDQKLTTSSLSLFQTPAEGMNAFNDARAGNMSEVKLYGPPGVNFVAKIEPALDPSGRHAGFFLRLTALANSSASQPINFKNLLESSGDAVVVFSPGGKPSVRLAFC